MKKTLIALAVAASAAVSGSAMAAWTANGTGGNVTLSGTITPQSQTPWEVAVGNPVSDLNVTITQGSTNVDIPVKNNLSILAIRTTSNAAFAGRAGITPQIKYGDATNSSIDTNAFKAGVTTLSMKVFDATSNAELGNLTVPFTAAAEASWLNTATQKSGRKSLFADTAGQAFFGGLATTSANALKGAQVHDVAAALNAESVANYTDQGAALATNAATDSFASTTITYSGYYSSGIQSGETARITLTTPVASSAINWKATLPVVVSYQ